MLRLRSTINFRGHSQHSIGSSTVRRAFVLSSIFGSVAPQLNSLCLDKPPLNSWSCPSLLERHVSDQQVHGRARTHLRAASGTPRAASGTPMSSSVLLVERVPALKDNYLWVLHEPTSGTTGVVDPAEATPVEELLKKKGWNLDYIINTHHHWDHTGGNLQLKDKYKCTVVGPLADKDRIPGIDTAVGDGDVWKFGSLDVHVFDTPGHTRGHISHWMPEAEACFVGDTLFALGCGRLFEGTPQQMWNSLSKLIVLPPTTRVFCAHEYTQSNAKFALTVDPANEKLIQRKARIDELRQQGMPTVPSTLAEELDTNPFLRPHDPAIRKVLGFDAGASDDLVFAAIRKAKDNF